MSVSTSTSTKAGPSLGDCVGVGWRRDDPGPLLDLDDRGRLAVGQVADVRDAGDDAEVVLVAAGEHEAAGSTSGRAVAASTASPQLIGVEDQGDDRTGEHRSKGDGREAGGDRWIACR